MEAAWIILIVVAVIAAVGVFGYLHHLKEVKRRQMLAALAARMGWRFDEARREDLPGRLPKMADFARGHSRYAYNTLTGQLRLGPYAAPFQAGDYHYAVTRSNGKSRSTHHYHFSYFAIRCGTPVTPRVTIRKEHFFDTLSAALGFNDIDFESAEFSRKFHVSSDDKRFAYDLIHPRAIEVLLHDSPNRLEIRGEWLCLTDGDQRWEGEGFQRWAAWLGAFLGLWPTHLDSSLGAARDPSTTTQAAR